MPCTHHRAKGTRELPPHLGAERHRALARARRAETFFLVVERPFFGAKGLFFGAKSPFFETEELFTIAEVFFFDAEGPFFGAAGLGGDLQILPVRAEKTR